MLLIILKERAIRQLREEKKMLKREKALKKKEEDKEREAVEKESQVGREYTLSIAVPGSIFAKIQSRELKTYVAGQVRLNLASCYYFYIDRYENFFIDRSSCCLVLCGRDRRLQRFGRREQSANGEHGAAHQSDGVFGVSAVLAQVSFSAPQVLGTRRFAQSARVDASLEAERRVDVS